MTSNPCQLLSRLLISVIACALNYRQVAGFVKEASHACPRRVFSEYNYLITFQAGVYGRRRKVQLAVGRDKTSLY